MQAETNSLGYAPVGKLLGTFAVPSIISMVVSTLYNIVDQIFIGRGVGYLGNGATNVILPLTVIALALGLMIGDGTTAYFSLCLGQKRPQRAAQGVGNAITLTVGVSILLTAVSLIFLSPLCVLFGATDATMPYALEYGCIIVLGFPFYMFSMGFNSIIRADGSPVYAMLSTLSGAILNTILDPIFIFVFHMGVRGAAIATVLGQVVSCVMTLLYLRRFRCITLKPDCLIPRWRLCGKVCSLGISSFFLQLAATIVIIVMNNVLVKYGAMSKYGAEIPMTTLGITMKVNQIITGIVIGISVGSQPIIGYNYGAGRTDRAKKTYGLATLWATVVMGVGTLVFQLFPHVIVGIFGSESALYQEFAVKSLKIFLLLITLNGFQLCTGTFFQAVGKPVQATLISLSRQVLFLLPALLILPHFFGVEGALWAGPVGDACAFIMALAFGLTLANRLVMPPMSTAKADADGHVTDALCAYYQERANYSKIGLIITEHSYIHPQGKAHPGQTSLASDDVIPGLRQLTDCIHREGVRVFAQLSHADSAAQSKLTGQPPVGPSPVYHPRQQEELPEEMTLAQIGQVTTWAEPSFRMPTGRTAPPPAPFDPDRREN